MSGNTMSQKAGQEEIGKVRRLEVSKGLVLGQFCIPM